MVRFILLALSALFISCDALNLGEGNLNADLDLKSNEIKKISDIDAAFTVRNGTNKAKEYNFNSGCQVSFLISQNGNKKFRAEEKLICTRALTEFELEPEDTKTLELPTFFDINLEPGNYTIKAYLIGYEDEVFAKETFKVK